MPTAALADRRGNLFPCDLSAVAFFGHDHDDRQQNMGGLKIGVNLDLRGCIVVAQRFYNTIDMGPQPLVVVPRDTTRDRELTLSSPQVATHIQ